MVHTNLSNHSRTHETHPLLLVRDYTNAEANIQRTLYKEISQTNIDPTLKFPLEEQLTIFMYIVGHSASNRSTQDRFQHSDETISIILSRKFICPPSPSLVHPQIKSNRKFYLYFETCLGVLDGIHIPMSQPVKMLTRTGIPKVSCHKTCYLGFCKKEITSRYLMASFFFTSTPFDAKLIYFNFFGVFTEDSIRNCDCFSCNTQRGLKIFGASGRQLQRT
ncbi:uncharacterized protein VP01_2403g1 [Puccinia sorghi]|uniref:DUF8040 domain-containing protein n=1 Tax=Puccinia sorghi TaxID=27349 RepID=A0A0L6V6Q8_9BASI|nr:uncharacterized protein VP01_2403g1 [Puccinia sorghi]